MINVEIYYIIFIFIVLAMRWLFTTYNVMSRNVTVKKWLVTVTKCDITLLSVINRYKSLCVILDIF